MGKFPRMKMYTVSMANSLMPLSSSTVDMKTSSTACMKS